MEQVTDPLVLKVMCLRKPTPEAAVAMRSPVPTGPKLLVPMALSQSFVGEPFAGYLHLANVSAVPVANVILKVELQIGPSQKYVLFNNTTSPITAIAPEDFFHTEVEHELRNAGTYVLTCTVSFTLPTLPSEEKLFKRSYKFPAVQPFSIASRAGQVDRQLLLECCVENETKASVYLTSWRLDCREGFEAILLGEEGASSSGNCRTLLRPRGTHSLVFRVQPKNATAAPADVGQLDLVGTLGLGWQRPDGPSGSSEGHQIRLKPLSSEPLELRVAVCPREIKVEVPFELELEVVNRSSAAVEPSLLLDPRLMGSVRVHGATEQAVGRLEPHCSSRLPLNLMAAMPGLHSLQGLSLRDPLTGVRTDPGACLCDILAF